VRLFDEFRSTFNEFASRHSKDERFRAVERIRDRESWFHEYVQELKTREKDGSHRHHDKEKVHFYSIEFSLYLICLFLVEKRLFQSIKRTKSNERFLVVRNQTSMWSRFSL